MKFQLNFIFLFLLIAGCTTQSGDSRVGEPPVHDDRTHSSLSVDQRAQDILRKMSQYLDSKQRFSFEAEIIRDEVLHTGERIQFGRSSQATLIRPNRLFAASKGDRKNGEIYFNGKNITLVDLSEKHYAVVPSPPSIDEAIDLLVQDYGISLPLADLFLADPYESLNEKVVSSRYLGIGFVRGQSCHHLAFRQDNIDWQLWVQDGHTPLPRKIVITYKQERGVPQFAAVITKWRGTSQAKGLKFEFSPNKGFEQIDLIPVKG